MPFISDVKRVVVGEILLIAAAEQIAGRIEGPLKPGIILVDQVTGANVPRRIVEAIHTCL